MAKTALTPDAGAQDGSPGGDDQSTDDQNTDDIKAGDDGDGDGDQTKDAAGADDQSSDGDQDTGDGTGDGDGDGDDDGDKQDVKDSSGSESDVVKIAPPEGQEHFAEDYGTYETFVQEALADNPEMTVAEFATKAAEWQAERVQKALDGAEAQAVDLLEKQVDDWEAEGKRDKEFGGDKYDENVAIALRGLDAVGTPELKTMLSQTGLGSHPEVIRTFLKIGQVFADPTIITSRGGDLTKKTVTEILYPNQPPAGAPPGG